MVKFMPIELEMAMRRAEKRLKVDVFSIGFMWFICALYRLMFKNYEKASNARGFLNGANITVLININR